MSRTLMRSWTSGILFDIDTRAHWERIKNSSKRQQMARKFDQKIRQRRRRRQHPHHITPSQNTTSPLLPSSPSFIEWISFILEAMSQLPPHGGILNYSHFRPFWKHHDDDVVCPRPRPRHVPTYNPPSTTSSQVPWTTVTMIVHQSTLDKWTNVLLSHDLKGPNCHNNSPPPTIDHSHSLTHHHPFHPIPVQFRCPRLITRSLSSVVVSQVCYSTTCGTYYAPSTKSTITSYPNLIPFTPLYE